MERVAEQTHEPDKPHHGPSLGLILGIFVTLMALTFVTVAAAYQDLGRWSAAVALAIAAVKGTLVVLYFMHLRYASRLIALYAASGFVFLAILLGITMSEVAGRPNQPTADPLAPHAPLAPMEKPLQRPIEEAP
jgi:cytochrome c oxidase subunit 4